MPRPSSALASLRPELESVAEFDLAADRMGFIGYDILPIKGVEKAQGTFGVIPLEQLLKHPETRRSPGSGFGRGKFQFHDVDFATKEHGWEEPVDLEEAELYEDFIDAEANAAEVCLDVILRAAETRIINTVLDSAVFTGALTSALTGGKEWTDPEASTPVDDIIALRKTIWGRTGLWPDTLAISMFTLLDLQRNVQIMELIKADGAGSPAKPSDVTAAMIAQCIGLREVLVQGSAQNTAQQGETAAIESMWPIEKALLFRKNRTGNFREAGLGRTLSWNKMGTDAPRYESYDEPQTDSRIIRRRHRVQEKIIYAKCGHVLTNLAA